MSTPLAAFIFPGQGSQSLGMLAELSEQFPLIQETYSEATQELGYDLWALVQQGPAELLNQTERTQPALLVGSVALWRLWQQLGGRRPNFLAGHSLGEYTALVCAEALEFRVAVNLVALRGRLMQAAVQEGQGAMAAIVGLDNKVVEKICQEMAQGAVLAPANFNAMGQVVIAGEVEAVGRAMQAAQQAGAKLVQKIPVSVPSHCLLMKPAAEQLAQQLEQIAITPPKIPVVTNVDVICYDDPQNIRTALVKQLYSPVRWVESMQYLYQMGVRQVLECGPGKVLTGLNKRINSALNTIAINTPQALQQALDLPLPPT
jgi:[acyl-carrier-protein] S-malonyltransferase